MDGNKPERKPTRGGSRTQSRECVAALQTIWSRGQSFGYSILPLVAQAYGQAGQPSAGLELLAEALDRVERTGGRWLEAELHRLQGELLRNLSDGDAAMACFRRAIAIARVQGARMWELRAATSLARLWQHQGRSVEARDLLASTYSWFTEGFDTSDLVDAKALLDGIVVNDE